MTLREDIDRILMDGNEHGTRDVLKQLPNDHIIHEHKDPVRSIRCCFNRMERKGEVVRIKDRVPIAVRRV
jgi:hypothetical protein